MTPDMAADRIAELEEDNKRLRRLLEQRDAPGELRHRLRSTLGLLRGVIRKSAGSGRDLPGYVAHLEDRLDAITRAQARADQHGEVDLRTLLADELFQYRASEGDRLLLTGPEIQLQARTGQVLALAFHELAVNAVEHGVLGTDTGRVEVSWGLSSAGPGAELALAWTEHGPAPGGAPLQPGFGTEVLTRMLAYELQAETALTFGPGGVSCVIRFALP